MAKIIIDEKIRHGKPTIQGTRITVDEVLGMLESFAGAYLGTFTMGNFGSEYKDIIAFLILILVIIFRPNGLLGEQVSQKA